MSIVALSATGIGAANASPNVNYTGSVPRWATHANDSGTPAADTSVEGELYLTLPNEQAAENFAMAVSTPGSPQYRHWLTPQQWIQRFSPSQLNFNSVVRYIKSQGMTITGSPSDRLFVVFRGTAAQVNAAFSTTLNVYSHSGTKLIAPSSAPTLPSSVASSVSAVSIDQSRLLTRPDSIQQGQGSTAGTTATTMKPLSTAPSTTPVVNAPCSTYWGQNSATMPAAYGRTTFPTNICGYSPSQLRSAYNLNTLSKQGVNGAGQTVAIIDAYASPSILSDVDTLSRAAGEPVMSRGQFQQIVPSTFYDQAACGEPSGWQSEQTLDVESVHSIAPKANILYVGGFNCGGGLDVAMATILDNHLANIVSNSYGNVGEDVPPDVIAGEQNIQTQAAGEGIGLYFSSGDDGDEVANLGYASPDFPASSPYVTAVGGTSVGVDQHGDLAMEVGWGDALDKVAKADNGTLSYTSTLPGDLFGGGSGGGVSAVNAEPAYQKGIVPSSLSNGMRVSPDVAALADPYTGFQIGISPITNDTTLATGGYVNETYGGTSLACPITAAQMALAQQVTHSVIGFANPTLYDMYRFVPSTFRDVVPPASPVAVAYTSATSGNSYLVSFNDDTSLSTTKGYDDVTGLGAMSWDIANLVARGHR